MLNLPNLLTFSRLAGIPILVWLLLARFPDHDQFAAGLFLIFSLTDTVDGQLARRLGQVTDLGKFLDPLADKLFILSVLVILVQEGLLSALVVVLIFGRELLITILRSVGLGQGRVIAASGLGKAKTVTQVGMVLAIILARPYSTLRPVAFVLVIAAVAVTLYSGLDYLWRFRYVLTGPSRRPAPLAPQGSAPGVGEAPDPLVRELAGRLLATGQSLVTAESCTGGLLAAAITDLPGSSAFFLGGVVSYTDRLKHELLGVPEALLATKGAVSSEVAVAMAEGARERLGGDFAISVTGIAGPGSDGTDKPAGLTFIGLAGPDQVLVRRFEWKGDRWQNRRLSVSAALEMAVSSLPELKP
ncbi:MAG: hypothetical protein NVS9B1_20030 [Candidatus Dormibacteraceae bacterium]